MRVVFDLFPARLLVISADTAPTDEAELAALTPVSKAPGSRTVDAVRIILTENTVLVAADSNNGPVLIFREKYARDSVSLQRNRKKPSRVVTESGKVLVFEKDENCGCGSMLRGWNPYRTEYSTKDPIE
jgi:hypothetical protein